MHSEDDRQLTPPNSGLVAPGGSGGETTVSDEPFHSSASGPELADVFVPTVRQNEGPVQETEVRAAYADPGGFGLGTVTHAGAVSPEAIAPVAGTMAAPRDSTTHAANMAVMRPNVILMVAWCRAWLRVVRDQMPTPCGQSCPSLLP
jgi:hypothetical protein